MKGHVLAKSWSLFWQEVRRAGEAMSFKSSPGATAVEYAIMLLFIAVVIIAAVAAIGQTLSGMFSSIVNGFR